MRRQGVPQEKYKLLDDGLEASSFHFYWNNRGDDLYTCSTFIDDNDCMQKRLPAIVEYNGEVHLFGGSYLASWSVFSVKTGAWRDKRPSLRLGRSGAEAAVVRDKLYVLGGQTIDNKAGVRDCEVYDYKTGRWKKISPMISARTSFAVAVLDNEIYVTGGQDEAGEAMVRCEKYSPRSDTWSPLPDLTQPRSGHVAEVVEGVVFSLGGHTSTTEWLDSESGAWVMSAPLASPLTGHGGCVATW